jgi:hypothetical protein
MGDCATLDTAETENDLEIEASGGGKNIAQNNQGP